ncbi:pseudaminic acid synthase [Salmonirosea aquatica]|uniref:Pseudaminic acid synthase n=1 Tax=Salmonirosea aquatica TaxID=2654236 RepID=A0A7C9BEB1_9BACT|nr:pseudaminic acid synthase [Cytophagaceae bacterium SJW1-29]
MSLQININGRLLGKDTKPFVIAEMSGNHNQSLDRALEIVQAAARSGAHALKLQTYTADTMTVQGALTISDPNSLWYGRELYDLYKEAYTPWEWHKPIFELATKLGLVCFSSPFDETAVDFLEELNVPFYKIASFENTHHPLLKKVARTGKPVIMSTGVSSIADIVESVQVLRENGCKELVLLKCTSSYPSTPENTNLYTIPVLQEIFPDCLIGLSDHTMGVGAAVAAVALGARVVEKHFTLSRAEGGVDSAFSLEPSELKMLVEETERAFLSLGGVQLNVQEAEKKSLLFKRSIYVVENIEEGEVFTEKNIRVIRPGDGMHPKYYEGLVGTHTKEAYKKGTPLKL